MGKTMNLITEKVGNRPSPSLAAYWDLRRAVGYLVDAMGFEEAALIVEHAAARLRQEKLLEHVGVEDGAERDTPA